MQPAIWMAVLAAAGLLQGRICAIVAWNNNPFPSGGEAWLAKFPIFRWWKQNPSICEQLVPNKHSTLNVQWIPSVMQSGSNFCALTMHWLLPLASWLPRNQLLQVLRSALTAWSESWLPDASKPFLVWWLHYYRVSLKTLAVLLGRGNSCRSNRSNPRNLEPAEGKIHGSKKVILARDPCSLHMVLPEANPSHHSFDKAGVQVHN